MLKAIRDYATPVAVLILAGVMLFDHIHQPGNSPEPTPAPVVNTDAEFLKLGHSFAKTLASNFGDAWLTASDTIKQGGPTVDALKAMEAKWEAGKKASFVAEVNPSFKKLLPVDTDPTDLAQRAAVARGWAAFGRGLKGETK